MRVSDATRGRICPYCTGKRIKIGFNDLASQRPDLAEEWDYEKNDNLKPNQVSIHSGKRVWFKCIKYNHSWNTVIGYRTGKKNSSCPYCSGHKILEYVNDLASQRPDITKEWDYDKNGDLKPNQIAVHSDKEVWFKCLKCNHSWKSKVNNRTSTRNSGCPNCCPISYGVEKIKQLLIEWKIDFEVEKRFNTCKNINCLPFDFYISDYNLLIEYNGDQHYKEHYKWDKTSTLKQRQKHDKIKENWTKENNINFLIISYKDKNNIENILKDKLGI